MSKHTTIDFEGLEEALRLFDENGIRGESNKWTFVRAAYDAQFEIHYAGETVLDCVANTLRGGYSATPEWNAEAEQKLMNIVSSVYDNVKQIKTVSSLDELKDHIEALGWRENVFLSDWLYEHKQATDDALSHFGVEVLGEIDHDSLVAWVSEHEQLWEDCCRANLADVDYNSINNELEQSQEEPDICDDF